MFICACCDVQSTLCLELGLRWHIKVAVCLVPVLFVFVFFFSSRRRHTRYIGDWSSDVCSSDLGFYVAWSKGTPILKFDCHFFEAFESALTGEGTNPFLWMLESDIVPQQVQVEIGRASCRERV